MRYDEGMSIPKKYLKTYCQYLDNTLAGTKFYQYSDADIEDTVKRFSTYYEFDGNKIRRKACSTAIEAIRDQFNRQYPEYVVKRMVYGAAVCLTALKIRSGEFSPQ
jgi:hypothetical protein